MSYETPERANARWKEFYQKADFHLDYRALPKSKSSFFETFALQNRLVISLFDCKRFEYIFHTSNVHDLFERVERKTSYNNKIYYPDIIGDKTIVDIITTLETEIVAQLTPKERCLLRGFICGRVASNSEHQNIKPFLQRTPVSFDTESYPDIYLDIVRNVAHLMTDKGIWLRMKAGEKVFSWFSEQEKLLNHDIVSPREKEVIRCWADSQSLSKIAKQLYISINTVKNHLKACRSRLHARDNTSLVQLCLLSDALNPYTC